MKTGLCHYGLLSLSETSVRLRRVILNMYVVSRASQWMRGLKMYFFSQETLCAETGCLPAQRFREM